MQETSKQALEMLLDEYPKDRRYALQIMQDIQRKYNHVPREGLEALAGYLDCPLSGLYSMATFYKALSLEPKGKHIIKVCDGTACHVRGSTPLISGIERILGIKPGQTTDDGEFSLELVNCLGACALAPIMVVDGKYYGKVTQDMLPGLFLTIREGAGA